MNTCDIHDSRLEIFFHPSATATSILQMIYRFHSYA